jgi:hypothetical protein
VDPDQRVEPGNNTPTVEVGRGRAGKLVTNLTMVPGLWRRSTWLPKVGHRHWVVVSPAN